jgi:hypothetical protein
MSMAIRLSFLFLLMVSVQVVVRAQDYLITTKGDSVVGKIKIEKIGIEKKLFLTTPEKKKLNYNMFQFRYAVVNNIQYVAIKRGDVYDIVQVQKKGYLTLYGFQLDNQFAYDGLYLGKADGKSIEVGNLTFKKQMIRFLEDCPSVVSRLENGEFKRSNIHDLVEAYNNCIDQNTKGLYASNTKTTTNTIVTNEQQWNELKEKLTNSTLENKEALLEMLEEIKSKKAKGEKIPNFLLSSFTTGVAADAAISGLFETLLQN